MALTRDYKEQILSDIQSDPKFADALFEQAIVALAQGEASVALSAFRDLVHARVTFGVLAEKTGIPEKSLHRMLGRNGNPTLKNLSSIVQVIGEELGLDSITVVTRAARARSTKGRRSRRELVKT